jgi:hypothetical protein
LEQGRLGYTLALQQGCANPGFIEQRHQQVGNIQQPGSPGGPASIPILQQIFQGIADIEVATGAWGLLAAKGLQPIQEAIGIDGQGLNPGAKATVPEERLQQVLHIHGPMPPAAGGVLGGQQELPGVLAEVLWVAGEAG